MSVGLSDEQTTLTPLSEESGAEAPAMLAASERRGALSGVITDARLLLIALWLGGAVFFSFVVAPTVFSVLPARELAGAVVTRTIAVVNVGGFVISLLLLATALFANHNLTRRARLVEISSLVVVAVVCGVGHWMVAARMLALRAAMGRPIDVVAADDPLRAAFNSLHGYSVGLMGAGILAGVVALLAIARRRNQVWSRESGV